MTADSNDSVPKKLKLTLKLGNSSSSSSSSMINSKLNSSTNVSPIKPIRNENDTITGVIHADNNSSVLVESEHQFSTNELSSGLGNLKGRGRPKKLNELKSSEVKEFNSNTGVAVTISGVANNTGLTGSSTSSSNIAIVSSNNNTNDYAVELKAFVTSMNSFKPRKWSLKRPLTLETKNVAGHEILFPCGLWCTFTSELGSSNLKISDPINLVTDSVTTAGADFETTCQCGKVFYDRSKFRKHSKIHEKGKNIENSSGASLPTISLKLKINTLKTD